MLDEILSCGEFFWRMGRDGNLEFHTFEELDWDVEFDRSEELADEEERAVYRALVKRGASFFAVPCRLCEGTFSFRHTDGACQKMVWSVPTVSSR